MCNILALDLGAKTGWALQYKGEKIQSGTLELKKRPKQQSGVLFAQFRIWLLTALESHKPLNKVCYEDVKAHRGTYAAHAYGGYKAILGGFCEEHNLPLIGVSVGTIKKHATNNGAADKKAVIKAMTEQGFKPQDDNEADAIALLLYALEQEN